MSNTGKIKVVGLCGLAGSGKTTAAKALEGYGFTRLPFAGPLKDMCRSILSLREMAGDLKETPRKRLGGKSPRQFMQLLGTEFGRDLIGPNFWVDLWLESVGEAGLEALAANLDGALVVADDVRFPNEAAAVHSLGGLVIRIERAGAGSSTGAGHPSEALDFEPDLVVRNVGSEEDFTEAIADAIADYAWAENISRLAEG
ncbi:hypothetical protein BA190_10300 [Labrys sp. WJW]|uniref:deoxynucleotide monophosphate kinase family protein n=1 Tax=Labrys sp. WJW TaxID=1737983 RepID=UPI00082D1457|nr:hypothetical protein [Labrys sp. WJW]OCC05285.1 hypothetical protein BA190_10300 [Labrys sp. WJW]